jgi:hypothetical protein
MSFFPPGRRSFHIQVSTILKLAAIFPMDPTSWASKLSMIQLHSALTFCHDAYARTSTERVSMALEATRLCHFSAVNDTKVRLYRLACHIAIELFDHISFPLSERTLSNSIQTMRCSDSRIGHFKLCTCKPPFYFHNLTLAGPAFSSSQALVNVESS